MAVTIKKFTRLAMYAFFLVLTAFVSALFGSKRSNELGSNHMMSLIPPAQADVPNSDGGGGDGDCSSGSGGDGHGGGGSQGSGTGSNADACGGGSACGGGNGGDAGCY